MNSSTVITIGGAIFIFCLVTRFLLAIQAQAWWNRRMDELEEHTKFDTGWFHEFQSAPRPWYVTLAAWMEDKGI